jgi:hypothetical protein
LLSRRDYPYAGVIARTDEGVRAYLIVDADKLQIGVGAPVQRYVKIAWKDLPLRSVVEFDKWLSECLVIFMRRRNPSALLDIGPLQWLMPSME